MTNKEELLQIITKLEKLEEEKEAVSQVITDTLAEAKIKGYDIKILKQVLKLRKMDNDERLRQEEELETYKATIGMK
ncbi:MULTISPECIES: GapR family DNA-binding domain-containing protein [Candidatus Bandiella]|uniref:DUF2312 domain-containing protein n=1 Tax=Candidatus Bandiella euplotis TaxID=1664265 RepID=A0ABZ0UML4_9RICK|nr:MULTISPECIES: GapR family DNA-binding domain-containing protein [Candidatus Bandiella]WPX97111.1 DUF2312 domain-containing protein [Candidatus Bandiella woodruffii]WPX97386.1 DUF2312 domain-containing protein [Candidatus Bandiella woodruffii]